MSDKMLTELKNLTSDELNSKLRESTDALFQARMKKATGQLEKTSDIWKLRKTIARAKTLQAGKTRSKKEN